MSREVSACRSLASILDGSVENHFDLDVGAHLAEDERFESVLEQLAQRLAHDLCTREKLGRAAVWWVREPFVLCGVSDESRRAKSSGKRNKINELTARDKCGYFHVEVVVVPEEVAVL